MPPSEGPSLHVLVAPTIPTTAGLLGGAGPLPGELVHLPIGVCDDCRSGRPCGWCEDAFTCVASHRATALAEVADRDLTHAMVIDAVASSLLDGNLFWGAGDARRRARDLAYTLATGLLHAAADLPPGTVVERHATRLRVRVAP